MQTFFQTTSRTNADRWDGGVTVLVTNTGGAGATVAGLALAAAASITLSVPDGKDHVAFDYVATGTTLTFTWGTRQQR